MALLRETARTRDRPRRLPPTAPPFGTNCVGSSHNRSRRLGRVPPPLETNSNDSEEGHPIRKDDKSVINDTVHGQRSDDRHGAEEIRMGPTVGRRYSETTHDYGTEAINGREYPDHAVVRCEVQEV